MLFRSRIYWRASRDSSGPTNSRFVGRFRAALVYSGLERDKAAAYFAQEEGGAQVLICSEIGSEGRNFQFANQLVMFDLPFNPDLLEQRIGRFIQSSLFVDGTNAGISDKLLAQVTDIFRWDIDFALDVRKGDRFALLYEEKLIDGEKVATGHILAAQFVPRNTASSRVHSPSKYSHICR